MAFNKGVTRRFQNGFFDRYTLSTVVLGEGSFATVLAGTDRTENRSVAVKTIDRSKLSERDEKKLFIEVEILKSFRHPNVVKVYECYEENDRFFLVMQKVEGGTLKDKMKEQNGPLAEDKVRKYVKQLLDALNYCKEKGVVHRDVKAENILVDANNRVKLADFNLAKKLDPSTINFTVLETMCGTPNYVAPEVLSGKPYDYKCDVWSVGVAAFYMLSYNLPFTVDTVNASETLGDLLAKVREGRWQFVPVSAWNNVSDSGKTFVFNCLQNNPDKRYDYAQLLGHKWFKLPEGERWADEIDVSSYLDVGLKRKVLSAAVVFESLNKCVEIMEQPEKNSDKNKNMKGYNDSIGAFDASFSFGGI